MQKYIVLLSIMVNKQLFIQKFEYLAQLMY